MKFGIGQSVPRTEDPRLLRGQGQFLDDVVRPGQLHAWFVRSQHAHARVVAIATGAARAVPGVVAVLTGADLDAAGVRRQACPQPIAGVIWPSRPALTSLVRHVGETVAVVLAETRAAARDGAEAVLVEYEALPARIGFAEGEPAFTWREGDAEAVDRAFAAAARIVRHRLHHNRVVPFPMEPRALLVEWDGGAGRLEMLAQTQGAHELQADLAAALGLALSAVRVRTGDVGGGFGGRINAYPEHIALAHAARLLGRPVKWLAERAECMLADHAGRGHETELELAIDADARFTALRFRWMSDLGAYATRAGPGIPTLYGSRIVTGCYAIPCQDVSVEGRYTNTVPIDAYRGAGKPEASLAIEAAVDAAAQALGIDPVALRLKNLVPPAKMPWTNAQGQVFDSGDFPAILREALARADHAGLPARRAEAAAAGQVLGWGVCMYVEPSGMRDQRVGVAFRADGTVVLTTTGQSNGQGHATALAQILADRLGVAMERILVVQGDSDLTIAGSGTGGSRVVTVGGAALVRAALVIEAKARRIAAHLLEAAEADIERHDGRMVVAGTDRGIGLAEIAAAAFDPARLPPGEDPGLEATVHHRQPVPNYPNGCHVAELSLDRETGALRLERYVAVNDMGTVINPALLDGQVQGGVAQAVGQVLLEDQTYDPAGGQLLAGSLMDYALPRADDLPSFGLSYRPTPCTTNPLGMKGSGEAGCAGGLGAVFNALADALAAAGAAGVEMPALPGRVFAALHQIGAAARHK
ncbi:MAG: xanthine dehydrogenase family protein [Acetobacteraceae bacterium]|nr:xanthine dehydrogenase family protein [Acetobacteraceae bacterium]